MTPDNSQRYYRERGSVLCCITGEDSERYLHGRVTQDIVGLKQGCGAWSLLLSPRGKVEGHFYILRLGPRSFYLVSDPLDTAEERNSLWSSLLRFKVADRVELTDESDTHTRIQFYNLPLSSLTDSVPESDAFSGFKTEINGCNILAIVRGGDFVDLVCKSQDAERVLAELRQRLGLLVEVSDEESLAERIRAGLPRWGKEITSETMGSDLPLGYTVSFTKGCYAGQEVLEMATARGRPNRRLVRLLAMAEVNDVLLASGSSLHESGSEAPCGSITSVVKRGEKLFGLGFVKNKVSKDASLFSQVVEFRQEQLG